MIMDFWLVFACSILGHLASESFNLERLVNRDYRDVSICGSLFVVYALLVTFAHIGAIPAYVPMLNISNTRKATREIDFVLHRRCNS